MTVDTLITGVIMLTGENGTGKSSAALEAGDPAKGLFVDDDIKGRATIDQVRADGIKFGRYVDFIGTNAGKKALDIHMNGLEIIKSIEAEQFDYVVWDTWTRFASTCHAYVQAHPSEFRDSWASMGKIKAGEEYKEARLYEASLIAEIQNRVPLVILVSHLKNQYLNNAPTGKQIPAVSKAVNRVCSLRLWLKRNPESPVPIALTLKNIDRKIYIEETRRLRTISILPTRIVPIDGERSIWDSIARYYENPAGLRKATPSEIPNDFERTIVDGTLTEDQRASWLFSITQEKKRGDEEAAIKESEQKRRAVEMKDDGVKLIDISKELGITVVEAMTLVKEE